MHDEHPRAKSERWLARQLRDAARREQPQFSESLHQRIMQAVRPTAAERFVAPRAESRSGAPRRRSYRKSAAWLTAAAVTVLAAVIAGRRLVGPDKQNGSQPLQSGITQSVAVQPTPSSKQTVDGAPSQSADVQPNEIVSLTANYTFDDLTRDAQATAHLLVDQLPFETPADEWGL
jgi:hypothetical protein